MNLFSLLLLTSTVLAALAPAASTGAPSAPGPGPWDWPVQPPPVVVRSFEPPPHPWSPGNRGVDLAVTAGVRLLSPTAGTVAFAGSVAGRPVVVVAHPGGLRSTFEPATAVLPVGIVVRRGQQVASVTGDPASCAPAGACLHWGVRRGQTYLDPLSLLGRRSVILVPLDP